MMKKIGMILVLLLLLGVSTAYASLAEIYPPQLKPYEAKIANPEGASYINRQTNETGVIPFETVVTVVSENKYQNDDTIYAYCMRKEEDAIQEFEVKLSDLLVESKEEMAQKDISQSTMSTIKVMIKGGTTLRKGPSKMYDEMDIEIPFGATVQCYDYATKEEWEYIDYQGTKGWMYNKRDDLYFFPKEHKELMLLETVNVNGVNLEEENQMVRFEQGETFDDYLERDSHIGGIGVYRDDVFATIDTQYLAVPKSGELEVHEEIVMANNPSYFIIYPDEQMVITKEIPVGTTLPYDYIYPQAQLFHVTYGEESGWVNEEGVFHKGTGFSENEKLEDFGKPKGTSPAPMVEIKNQEVQMKKLMVKMVIGIVFLAVIIFVIIKKKNK